MAQAILEGINTETETTEWEWQKWSEVQVLTEQIQDTAGYLIDPILAETLEKLNERYLLNNAALKARLHNYIVSHTVADPFSRMH